MEDNCGHHKIVFPEERGPNIIGDDSFGFEFSLEKKYRKCSNLQNTHYFTKEFFEQDADFSPADQVCYIDYSRIQNILFIPDPTLGEINVEYSEIILEEDSEIIPDEDSE